MPSGFLADNKSMESLKRTTRDDQEAAQALLADDRHYVGAVARLGDREAVVAATDIVARQGVKLLAEGTPVDSRILDKLLGHQLRTPLDHQLAMQNGVTPATLAHDAAVLIAEDVWWRHLAAHSGNAAAMPRGLERLTLPTALCIKLAVARDQRPSLYQHSLRVAILAQYLALKLALSGADTERLLLAALCHDLGELHTDPAIFATGHRIADAERRFIYVHPVAGYLILKQLGVDPQVAHAVLQHQERLDGSGYPTGLHGEAIAPLARVLMVADIAESVLARFADHRRLSVLLRLNTQKYDPRVIAKLHEALGTTDEPLPEPDPLNSATLGQRLATVAALLAGWAEVRRLQGETAPAGSPLTFLYERIHALNSTLLEFGFDPDSFGALVSLAQEDRDIAAEMQAVLDETRFQFAEMAQETDRREEDGKLQLSAELQAALSAWRRQLKSAVAESESEPE